MSTRGSSRFHSVGDGSPEASPRSVAGGAAINPILYQPARVPWGDLVPPTRPDDVTRIIRLDGQKNTGYVAVLSHSLPEPTSYSGRNLIALPFAGDAVFSERTGQSRLLAFDGKSTYVDCGNPSQIQGRKGNSLTIEAWVRLEEPGGGQVIVTHGGSRTNDVKINVFLQIWDHHFEFGTWFGTDKDGKSHGVLQGNPVLRIKNEDVGVWVHLAGVYDHTNQTYYLYKNGVLLSKEQDKEIAPTSVDASWFIGARKNDDPRRKEPMWSFFKGNIAEVRIWTVARTEKEIRENMDESAPRAGTGQLGALWHLADGKDRKVADSSGRGSDGAVQGDATWKWAPSPLSDLTRLTRRRDKASVQSAFETAQATGIFDPLVFPRIRGLMTQMQRTQAKAAIASKKLSKEDFWTFYESGYHLILRRAFSGEMEFEFVPNPAFTPEPRLMLIEEYRLSSFLGSYGVGRVVKTFSLLPGERTKLTIRTESSLTTTAKETQSILDSYSKESADDFESSLSDERSKQSSGKEEFSYNASAEGSASWGWGSVSAKAGFSGSTNSAREEFAKSVSNATSKHAAKASANRNVQIDTSTETTKSVDEINEVVRDIENINVGRTLNFVFCQMNQEVISLLHLVDVRIGYTNGLDPVREVALYELPELLDQVVTGEKRSEVETFIIDELKAIRDHAGNALDSVPADKGFIVSVPDGAAGSGKSKKSGPARYAVSRKYVSTYQNPATAGDDKEAIAGAFTVPGIIISANVIGMRTEDVVVDAIVGEGWALDAYARELQEQEKLKRQLANEDMILELKRKNYLHELAQKKEIELLKVYADAIRPTPPGDPSRVVSIWEADPSNGPANGS